MRFLKITKNCFLIFRQIHKAEKGETSYQAAGPKINALLSDLGPTFIKLGQMLSMRADLINSDLADQLRALLDHGSVVEEADINSLFKSELGKTPNKIFKSFESRPFAVASLSQVHRAVFEGKTLAVKVQKPGIRQLIHKDLYLIRRLLFIARLISLNKTRRELIRLFSISVDEFFKWIEHELDYRLEILNISRIKNNFSAVKFFKAPEVIHELSGKMILSMEYIEGVSLNTLIDSVPGLGNAENIVYKDIHCSKKVFIKEMLDIVFKQVFEDGYFHADPHPANILLTHRNSIAFIDFGVIGALSPRLKEVSTKILSAVIARDPKSVSESLMELNETEIHPPVSVIEKEARSLLDEWQTGSVIEMSMAEVFYRLLLIAQKSKIEIPLPLFVFGKTILEYDGLLCKFDPEMDIVNSLKSYVEKNSAFSMNDVGASIKEILANPENLPESVLKIARELAEEGVKFASHLAGQK